MDNERRKGKRDNKGAPATAKKTRRRRRNNLFSKTLERAEQRDLNGCVRRCVVLWVRRRLLA
ncbi:hypothetical protein F2Q68_00011315 [Brassica cretica]|uniref:Uncharacterized protein n=1 Tax=Brassica cretica TaxID=69181 RepID=A0A8S9L099_BRACR|nr:hypothetical protein F2Q68_00011315 [Brassica cretica]